VTGAFVMVPGRDYIGIGVGAMVFDSAGRVFLARRGPAARNEFGTWEFPGGMVDFGERLEDAVRREFREEYGMEIEPTGLLGVFDHLLPDESEHWVSATYLARHLSGVPERREPTKCSEIGWFDLSDLPAPLSLITQSNVTHHLTERRP
jgi:8-oxo-dGTP diphosphatase